MVQWVVFLVAGASLVLAALTAYYVIRDRLPDDRLMGGLVLLEVLLLVQAVVGLVALARTGRDLDALTFVAYLVGSLLVLPAVVVWSLAERSRSGTGVLIVGLLSVPVLLLRLDMIWTAGTGAA